MKQRLQALGARLNRLGAERPDPQPPGLRRRVLAWLHGRPRISTIKIAGLVEHLRSPGGHPADRRATGYHLREAVRELERGVGALERSVRYTGRLPPGQLGWLWRLYQIVYRGHQLSQDSEAWRQKTGRDALESVHLRHLASPDPDAPAGGRGAQAVDPLLEAARQELRRLGRRRRLLEAARQVLLEAAAASPLDPAAVKARQAHIRRELMRLDRLQAAGLQPDVDLIHQARQARSQGDRARLFAALTAIEEAALGAEHGPLARLAERALGHLWPKGQLPRVSRSARTVSLAVSQAQLMGGEVHRRVEAGYQRARETLPELIRSWSPETRQGYTDDATAYVSKAPVELTMAAAVAAGASFELGGTVSPVRTQEVHEEIRQVRHPTQDVALVPARGVEDLKDALIDDPRTVIPALASGTLLTRRYQAVERTTRERQGMINDARLYVLDGSGSMLGPRARMRDGLLVAELATLAARLQDPVRPGNPVLYFAYFDQHLGPFHRVATVDQAHAAIESVIAAVRVGATDIQAALTGSFAKLREARDSDPHLRRAQVILVTDGEAEVDGKAVESARAEVGDIPIGVSIIALGQENPALRQLAAHQRERGERVFYQFMDDGELAAVDADRAAGPPIHLPAEQGAGALDRELDQVLEEIEQQLRPLDVTEMDRASVLDRALAEAGIEEDDPIADRALEGLRARREALMRDERALRARFERWFPAPVPGSIPLAIGPADHEAMDDLAALLASVAEVISVGICHPLERQSDAIEIAERLLREAALPPWRYAELLRRYPAALAPALAAVRAAAAARSDAAATRA